MPDSPRDEFDQASALDQMIDQLGVRDADAPFGEDDKARLQGFIPGASAADVEAIVAPADQSDSDAADRKRLAALALAIALYLSHH